MADTTKRWAVLIGIDFYFKGTARAITFDNLNGCVQDVLAVEQYLLGIGVIKENIVKLTASVEKGKDKPTEDETLWPTHDNIVRELKRITKTANQGDLVYIHYSGHGIRRDIVADAEEGDNISGTALAPTDVLLGGAYLTGYKLGCIIRNMVEKEKLRVTLVLDSCFSGRGMRKSSTFKARTSVGEIDGSILKSDIDSAKEDMSESGTSGQRGASVKPSWLYNPSGCTVLTACGVHETAGEDKLGSIDGKHGVLTYWMLDLLQRASSKHPLSYARIHEHVQSKIESMVPKLSQSPVLLGDDEYEFFGKVLIVQRPVCLVSNKYDNHVVLDVGRAQCAAIGAIYDIFPESWDIEPEPTTEVSPPQARITKVFEFKSEAILLPPSDNSSNNNNMAVEVGSCAILRTWALESETYVKFEYPPDRPDLDTFRNLLKNDIEKTTGLYLCSDNATAREKFTVSIDQQMNFQIRDENGVRLSRLPKISARDKKGNKKLADVLRHLARFKAIEDRSSTEIQSPLPSNWFALELLNGESIPLKPDSSGKYQVLEGEDLNISFTNKSNLPSVYVTFFDLNPSTGVDKLYPPGKQSSEETHRTQPVEFSLSMTIPNKSSEEDPASIDDIIRVFVYAGEHPPSWNELSLPDIREETARVLPDIRVDSAGALMDLSMGPSRKGKVKPKTQHAERWQALDLLLHISPQQQN